MTVPVPPIPDVPDSPPLLLPIEKLVLGVCTVLVLGLLTLGLLFKLKGLPSVEKVRCSVCVV